MSRAASPSSGHVYGLPRVCRPWDMPRATVHRHMAGMQLSSRRHPGPQGQMDGARLLAQVRQMIESSPFHGARFRKVWARLRFASIRTSLRRVLRLMRENSLLAPHRLRMARVKAHAEDNYVPGGHALGHGHDRDRDAS